jgi:uncharacterized protein
LSNLEARRLAIAAQGLAGPRPQFSQGQSARAQSARGQSARGQSAGSQCGGKQLRRLMGQVGTIQLDAVNVLERTQYLVPFSRLGSYDPGALRALSGPGAPWFEYWGHAASLLPLELQPLFRWRMDRSRQDLLDNVGARERRRAWRAAHAEYIAAVLAEVTDRGPLPASQLSEPRRRTGQWWERRSLGRVALELLFGDGALAAWRSPNFERVYDLTEKVIPAEVLALPTPAPEEAQRELIALAARCLGIATAADLADYFWMRVLAARPRMDELVEDGTLSKVSVEGWSQPAYMVTGTVPTVSRRREAALISPFDSLIWTRPRTQRLFNFNYRIEIYVPSPHRTHGYYVMPLLLGDELVARFDLKSDRKRSALLVLGAFGEPGKSTGPVAEAALAELHRLRQWLGLESLMVGERGDLAPHLAASGLR